MSIEYDKPFKTYDQQIILLESRGLIINDKDFARHALETFSYYDLVNGYKDALMPNDKYLPNITIEFLYDLFMLDKSVQSMIVKYSLMVENLFKTKLSYVLAKKYGVDTKDYLNEHNYNSSEAGLSYVDDVKNEILPLLQSRGSKHPTKHYLDNHNHVPPWILFKNISLGTSINFFRFLKTSTKTDVSNSVLPNNVLDYNAKTELIIAGLEAIRLFRNCAAHNLKFVSCELEKSLPLKNMNKLVPPLIYKKDGQIFNTDKKALRRLYGVIVSILIFLNDSKLQAEFIKDFIIVTQDPYNDSDLHERSYIFKDYIKLTKLPVNIISRLMNFVESLD